MPRVFASTPAIVEISAAEAIMNKDNAAARMRVMLDPPLFDVFVVAPARRTSASASTRPDED
jgi:hypothetical protein